MISLQPKHGGQKFENCNGNTRVYNQKLFRWKQIEYADDTTLIAAVFEKLSLSTEELSNACNKMGVKVNADKCKIISDSPSEIKIGNEIVKKVKSFEFLGSVVPGSSDGIKRKIGLASCAFGSLKQNIWCRKDVSTKFKVRHY